MWEFKDKYYRQKKGSIFGALLILVLIWPIQEESFQSLFQFNA